MTNSKTVYDMTSPRPRPGDQPRTPDPTPRIKWTLREAYRAGYRDRDAERDFDPGSIPEEIDAEVQTVEDHTGKVYHQTVDPAPATVEAALDAATEAVEAEFASMNAGSDHGARDVAEAAVNEYLAAAGLLRTPITAEQLGQHWRTFKEHHPVGAYLPIGQLDGDCRSCGHTWPCPTALGALVAAGVPVEGSQDDE